ncbi:hypothetical protein RRG08_011482 [Elysia crispata]|uniref:Uncharacterized protein n=1 Tax=Elysia crispata TaxID=231223 RepID=A0AAE1B8M9_9GAST|nr:hypothetical protein RRG08_011482 [Elysia crispata]
MRAVCQSTVVCRIVAADPPLPPAARHQSYLRGRNRTDPIVRFLAYADPFPDIPRVVCSGASARCGASEASQGLSGVWGLVFQSDDRPFGQTRVPGLQFTDACQRLASNSRSAK